MSLHLQGPVKKIQLAVIAPLPTSDVLILELHPVPLGRMEREISRDGKLDGVVEANEGHASVEIGIAAKMAFRVLNQLKRIMGPGFQLNFHFLRSRRRLARGPRGTERPVEPRFDKVAIGYAIK